MTSSAFNGTGERLRNSHRRTRCLALLNARPVASFPSFSVKRTVSTVHRLV
jgi:hypothetical protein